MKHPGRNSSRLVERRQEAKQRNSEWTALSPEDQLKELDKRLGVGQGAKRQRKRLEGRVSS